MWGSEILDVAIGLVLVYLLLSFIASAIREAIESVLRSRAAHLEKGIRELLHDPDGVGLAQTFYKHPLIFGLYRGDYDPKRIGKNGFMPPRSTLPSYIPSRIFALALLDIAARGPHMRDSTTASGPPPALTLANVRATVSHIDNPAVQRVLLTAVDTAQNRLSVAQENIQDWFDSGMDRVSGWYKRQTQRILLAIGLFIAIAANVNTIAIANALYQDDNLRASAIAMAERARTDPDVNAQTAMARLDSLKLPIGWPISARYTDGSSVLGIVAMIVGWIFTGLAVSLGAPFWFDLLNKMMVIRSTVKPHEKSPEEGSEDHKEEAKLSMTPSTPEPEPAARAPAQPPPPPVAVPVAAGKAAAGFQKQAWADDEPDRGVI
jgi:hypothetical protein